MGTLYTFSFTGCGYQANVGGGPDIGFVCKTQTGFCRSCNQLVDYATEIWAGDGETEKGILIGCCGKCDSRVTDDWNLGDPCPRCQGKFSEPVFYMDWD
jgi:uncharacterized CHY-type Zn-finger protein